MNKILSFIASACLCLTVLAHEPPVVPYKIVLWRAIQYEFNIACPMVKEIQGYKLYVCKDGSGIFVHPDGTKETFSDVFKWINE